MKRLIPLIVFLFSGLLYAQNGTVTLDGKQYNVTLTPSTQPSTQPVPPAAPAPKVVKVTKQIDLKSNQVFDGSGKVYEVDPSVKAMFWVNRATNVVVKNLVVKATDSSHVLDVYQSTNVTIDTVHFATSANYGIRIRQCGNVTIKNVKADLLRAYTLWVDNSTGVSADNIVVTRGSKYETSVRVMENTNDFVLSNSAISAVYAPPGGVAKLTALRLHGPGGNYVVKNSYFAGQVWIGPMGGNDGGQLETDPVKRRKYLSYRTRNVTFTNCKVEGSIGVMAGLQSCVFQTCEIITGGDHPPYSGYPVTNVDWTYPEKKYLKPGDESRPLPECSLVDVKFVAPKRTTINWGTNGPFKLTRVSLNGKPLN